MNRSTRRRGLPLISLATAFSVAMACPHLASGAILADLIDTPFSTTSAAPNSVYDSATLTIFLDPANTNWMALSIGTALRTDLPNLSGIPTIQSAQSDDAIRITATIGSATSSQITIEDNDAFNLRVGNQAIFFGSFSSVGSFNGFTTATYAGLPETGALTSFFNAQGAGTYTLSVSFFNRFTNNAGHVNVYLLRDVNQPPTGEVPEPGSLTIWGAGALAAALGACRRRRAQKEGSKREYSTL
jgi:MYXO-CTERM domain-containing protein